MQTLYFIDFLSKHCNSLLYLILQNETEEFSRLNSTTTEEISKELSGIRKAYDSFSNRTLTSDHDRPAQYWMGHINMVNLY